MAKEIQREKTRKKQQRYRDRQKVSSATIVQKVIQLRQRIELWGEYRDLMLQKNLLTPTHRHTGRYLVTRLFSDTFIDKHPKADDSIALNQMHGFLRFNFYENATMQSGEMILKGPESISTQWQCYTVLFGDFTHQPISSEMASPDGSVFLFYFQKLLHLNRREQHHCVSPW